MDLLDLIIFGVAVAAAVGGYRIGFLGRAVSWLGLALGFYIGIKVLPPVLVRLSQDSPTTLVVVAVAILVGAAMIGQALGMVAGSKLHHLLPFGPVRVVDRVIGAVVGAAGIVAVLWLLLPSLAAVPGWPARAVSQSAISRWVSENLPRPPDALQVLRRLVGSDAPQVFAVLQPGVSSGPPPTGIPLPQTVAAAVEASTVKVQGQACDRIYEGSGWAVGTDLIMTNAHVVAGEGLGSTQVLLPSGRTLPASVVMFDPNIDLSLLYVPGLGESPLTLATPSVGQTGAVFGHPNGVDQLVVTPARVASEEQAVGLNIYDTHDTKRDVLVLASALAHGDSGGALVDAAGQVIGVAFAISADQSNVSYALATSEVRAALAEPRAVGTSTGSCLTNG